MPDHASPKKRMRRDAGKRLLNHSRISRIRTFIKKFEKAIEQKAVNLPELFREVQKEVMRGVSKGVLHKKTASRKVSALHGKFNAAS
jgi:small subunit ribosomal protein S20